MSDPSYRATSRGSFQRAAVVLGDRLLHEFGSETKTCTLETHLNLSILRLEGFGA